MAKTTTFDIDTFKSGLHLLEDDSVAPIGSARRMLNVQITDRGGIAPRPGTELLGTRSLSTAKPTGFFVFKKSFGAKEIPMRAYDDELEAYHPTEGWFRVKNGYTVAQDFDFMPSLVNVDNEDYVYFCNRYEPLQRWNGQITLLNGALAGGETAITVDSTLEDDIFETGTATAGTATTVTDSSKAWATDQWKNFYVHFTSGTYSGKVRKISANTGTQLTFATLAGAIVASDTFRIVKPLFDVSTNATFIYNGTEITVTAVESATTLSVASAHAAPDNTPITNVPQAYGDAPRGNRIESLVGRTLIGNVRSALSRDSGGALQGSNSAGSVFVSKLNDPKDFTFSATRTAGQGDIISMPYGGGDITDIAVQEDVAYVYKRTYIESIKYSGDSNDLAVRKPLKSGVGSVGRVVKGRDDHYFITQDKQLTTIGRVLGKDQTVQTENIGMPIKRLLEEYDQDSCVGTEFKNRVLISMKTSGAETYNNIILVFNQTTKTFEGVWNIGAQEFGVYGEELYYQSSYEPNVHKMFTSVKTDVLGADTLPITAVWESNFFNLLPIKAHTQGVVSVALEGYIATGSTFTFNLYKDFATTSSLSFDFGSESDEAFKVGATPSDFMGANPLGLDPIGTVDSPGSDGRRRFSFIVFFPAIYGQYFSFGLSSDGKGQDWEVVRVSLGLRESVSTVRPTTKVI